MNDTPFHSDEEIDAILAELNEAEKTPRKSQILFSPVKQPFSRKKELLEWGKALILAAFVTFFVFFVLLRIVSVEGHSMEPTLMERDYLVMSDLFYTPKTGDIVVTSAKNGLHKPLVKRIIAMGGQTVEITDEGIVVVDGKTLEEPYAAETIQDAGALKSPLLVPEGELFLMGDNRNHSTDSRLDELGCVPEKEILGRVLFRLIPLNRIGVIH